MLIGQRQLVGRFRVSPDNVLVGRGRRFRLIVERGHGREGIGEGILTMSIITREGLLRGSIRMMNIGDTPRMMGFIILHDRPLTEEEALDHMGMIDSLRRRGGIGCIDRVMMIMISRLRLGKGTLDHRSHHRLLRL